MGVTKPQGSWSHLELEESKKGPSQNMALVIHWFQTSGFQSCDRINFCSYKALSLWSFVKTALENQCNLYPHLSRMSVLCFHLITKVAPPKFHWLWNACRNYTCSALTPVEWGWYLKSGRAGHQTTATWACFPSGSLGSEKAPYPHLSWALWDQPGKSFEKLNSFERPWKGSCEGTECPHLACLPTPSSILGTELKKENRSSHSDKNILELDRGSVVQDLECIL